MVKRFFLLFFVVIVMLSVFINIFLSKVNNKDTILFGTSLPLSGINKELGREVIQGANTYFSHVNARGGIDGKLISLIFMMINTSHKIHLQI